MSSSTTGGCSGLKKSVCAEKAKCDWVVAKGCRSTKPRAAPKKILVSDLQLKEIQKKVSTDARFKTEARELTLKLSLKYVKSRFAQVNFVDYSVKTLKFLTPRDLLGSKRASAAKAKGLSSTHVLTASRFEEIFKNVKGNTVHLSEESAKYVAGVLEYLVASLMTVGVQKAKSGERGLVTKKDVEEGIRSNETLKKAFGDYL
jgi:histone H3/H4